MRIILTFLINDPHTQVRLLLVLVKRAGIRQQLAVGERRLFARPLRTAGHTLVTLGSSSEATITPNPDPVGNVWEAANTRTNERLVKIEMLTAMG